MNGTESVARTAAHAAPRPGNPSEAVGIHSPAELRDTRRASLRQTLLLGILVPVLGFVLINSFSLYQQALQAADTAYDRTLLASAKSLGEQLNVRAGSADGPGPSLQAELPYSALEAFEADNRSRIFYRISGFAGEMVSGFQDLPPPRPAGSTPNAYAALVHFYDEVYQSEAVRMAVLLQPVAGTAGHGVATIQVAETLEVRRTLARSLLLQSLWHHAALVLVIAAVVVWVVHAATKPVRALSQSLGARAENDLSPLPIQHMPRELLPVVAATNGLMARLSHLMAHQKRFVRDASHQLRTPLAVLKTQLQSAQRGDVEPQQAFQEMASTVEGATAMATQLLALARVEQLRNDAAAPSIEDWAWVTREVALDVSALIAHAQLDFEIHTSPSPVRAHAWALRELVRNLLHNAIRHSPRQGQLTIRLNRHDSAKGSVALLCISDSGPGIAVAGSSHTQAGPERTATEAAATETAATEHAAQRLFEPFASQGPHAGSGLGLAICQGIVQALGGRLELVNRKQQGRVVGLDARVSLPLS